MAEGIMQGNPQVAPQEAPQGEPQRVDSFPRNDEEGESFVLNLVKLINSDEKVVEILEKEGGGKAPSAVLMGALAAQLLTLVFTKLYEQTEGQQVNAKFVVQIIRVAIKEIADIADGLGLDTTVEDEQQAAKIAGDALDESMEQLYSGGQPAEGEPQAMPEEAPQAPPQGGLLQGGM